MLIWMMVTKDEYELPLAIADTAGQLAEIAGVTRQGLKSTINYYKKKGKRCRFVKVEIEED